jgi:hypothetical protein
MCGCLPFAVFVLVAHCVDCRNGTTTRVVVNTCLQVLGARSVSVELL